MNKQYEWVIYWLYYLLQELLDIAKCYCIIWYYKVADGPVWFGSTLLEYAILSEHLVYKILGHLPYSL